MHNRISTITPGQLPISKKNQWIDPKSNSFARKAEPMRKKTHVKDAIKSTFSIYSPMPIWNPIFGKTPL